MKLAPSIAIVLYECMSRSEPYVFIPIHHDLKYGPLRII